MKIKEVSIQSFVSWYGFTFETFADYDGFYIRVVPDNPKVSKEAVENLENKKLRTRKELVEAFRPYDNTYQILCDEFWYRGYNDYEQMYRFLNELLDELESNDSDDWELTDRIIALMKIIQAYIDYKVIGGT